MPRQVLILAFSNLPRDGRILKQVQVARSLGCTVTTAGYAPLEGMRHFQVDAPTPTVPGKLLRAAARVLHLYEQRYWCSGRVRSLLRQLHGETFDLVIANDIDTLPLALSIAGRTKVMWDAHEYAPREWEDVRTWRWIHQPFVKHLCKRYIPQADAWSTVNEHLAQAYRSQYGVEPIVAPNMPSYAELSPSSRETDQIRLVHHGAADPSREIETMLEAVRQAGDRFSLDLYLVPSDPTYLSSLKIRFARTPNIRFRTPVGHRELVSTLSAYDVGIYLLPPRNFNHLHALPSKLFDYIQARLAVLIGPSPAMADVVTRYNVGVVCNDFSPAAFSAELCQLSRKRIEAYRKAAHAAASQCCFESSWLPFRTSMETLLENSR